MAELEPRNFLQPCLLLLLMERSDHGYELAARLRPMHDGEGDPGSVYRALRGLERQGVVRSEWCRSDQGPARRTYSITDDGVVGLADLADGLRATHAALHVFMERYARVLATDPRVRQEVDGHDRHPSKRHPDDRQPDDRHRNGNGRPGGLRTAGHAHPGTGRNGA